MFEYFIGAFWLIVLALIVLAVRRYGTAEVLFGAMVAAGLLCGGLLFASPAPAAGLIGVVYAAVAALALYAVVRTRATEKRVVAELFPREEGDGRVGDHLIAGRMCSVRLSIAGRRQGVPARFLDSRVVVLSVRAAGEGLSLASAPRFDRRWPGPQNTVARRYWLDPAVIAAVRLTPHSRIVEGRVEVCRGKWCTRARLEAWLAELGTIAGPLLSAEERVARRVTTEADPMLQRLDWAGLTTWAPARARALATNIPPTADPAVVVGAATLRGDVALLESMLRTTDHPEALEALAGWARREERFDLAPLLARRLGVPPERAWDGILRALHDLAGRDEMAVLQEVADGVGYPGSARLLAVRAIDATRARLGHELAGTVAIADVPGGALSVTDMASEGALSRPDLARDAPSTTGRGDPSACLDLDDP